MRLEVPALRVELACDEVRDVLRRPDLAMGMGIAATHEGALVLEYLDVADGIEGAETADSSAQASTTDRMPGTSMSARVKSCRGEKHRTRQVPRVGWAWSRSSSSGGEGAAASGRRAGKSLSNANVDVYAGFVAPFARRLPGQR